MIISVSGSVGTGKTEVAALLAKRLGYALVKLNELAEKKKLYSGYDDKRRCKIVDLEAIEEEVKKNKSRNLVMESHYSHELPSDVAVILRCHPKELRKRLEKRGYTKKKIEENIDAEIMEVCKSEALELGRKIIEADTTGKKPGDVADEIIPLLNRKRYREGSR